MRSAFVFLFVVLFFSCSQKNEGGEVLARVNNRLLTKKELAKLTTGELGGPQALSRTINRWVERRLLYNAAIAAGLKKDKNLIQQRDGFYQNLLISSFVGLQTKNRINITKKDVSAYYIKNKGSFKRTEEEILVKHFVLPNKKVAEKLKQAVKKKNRGSDLESLIKEYQPEIKTLKKKGAGSNLAKFVFSGSPGSVLGPKKHSGVFHVFEILQKHKKGSTVGLEFVYDEIYQRIYKQKELSVLSSILDSLYLSSDVYVSSELQR